MEEKEKNYKVKRFEEAEKLGSWHSLIGYASLLFSWQTRHTKDIREIAELSSHWHGYTHFKCDVGPTYAEINAHPQPHGFCHGRCEEIEELIQKNLKERLVHALRVRAEQIPQRNLI